MTRHIYTTTLSSGTDGEADYIEMEATFTFTYLPGRKETPPGYDHGGLPADPPLIEDVELVLIDGKPRPWFQFESDDVAADWAGGGLDAAYDHHIAEMLAIAEDRW